MRARERRAEAGGNAFGNVMQVIDATPFRGKRVRLRGAVRVEGKTAAAALWMRVDRPSGRIGFFDNMNDRPIASPAWTYYEIAATSRPTPRRSTSG